MLKSQKGFTLIELVMVIVILGILAAVAIPKYIDLTADANKGAVQGVAGSMSSAMAVNYAARSMSPTNPKTSAVTDCANVTLILQGGTPTGYNVPSAAIAAGATANCVVGNGTYSTTFLGMGIN